MVSRSAGGNIETDGGEVFDCAYDPVSEILVLTVGDFSLQFYDCSSLKTRVLLQNEPLSDRPQVEDAREEMQRIALSVRRRGSTAGMGDEGSALEAASVALRGAVRIRGDADGRGGAPRGNAGDSPLSHSFPLDDPFFGSGGGSAAPSSRLPRYITRVHTATPQRGVLHVPDAGLLLTYGVGREVAVWTATLRRVGACDFAVRAVPKATLTGHDDQVTDMALLRDVGLVATAGLDGCVCLWAVKGAPDGAGGRRGINDDASHAQQAMAASHGLYLHTKHAGVHARGVRCLLYQPSSRTLLSAGFEGIIQAYDMGCDDGRAGIPTLRLEGHEAPVVGMTSLEPHGVGYDSGLAKRLAAGTEASHAAYASVRRRVPHFSQFVSADDRGCLRWWDLSRDICASDSERCLQAWTPYSATLSGQAYKARGVVTLRAPQLSDAAARRLEDRGADDDDEEDDADADGGGGGGGSRSCGSTAVVMAVGPRQKFFSALQVEDDRVIAAAGLYQDLTTSFIAVSRADVRVYSAETGAITRSFRSVLPGDAAAGCTVFDGRRRKMLVGCTNGTTAVLNSFTGKPLKLLPPHEKDVVGIVYVASDNTVITAGADGSVIVSDELVNDADGDSGRTATLRRLTSAHGPGAPIAAMAFDYQLSCIATGSGGGVGEVRLWDYQDLTLLGRLSGHDADIAALCFLPPFPALASVDTTGVVNIWHVPRGAKPRTRLATFTHSSLPPRQPVPSCEQPPSECFALPQVARDDVKRVLGRLGVTARTGDADLLRHSSALTGAEAEAGALDAAVESVTCMTAIPGTSSFGGGGGDDSGGGNALNRGGSRRFLFSRSSTLPDAAYPSLALGDDAGHVAVVPLAPVFQALFMRVGPDGGAEFASAEDAYDLPFAPFAPGSGAWLRLRTPVDPVVPSSCIPAMNTYNPRKTCKRQGGSKAMVHGEGATAAPLPDADGDDSVAAPIKTPSSAVTSRSRAIGTPSTARSKLAAVALAATASQRSRHIQLLLPIIVGHALTPAAVVTAHGTWRASNSPAAALRSGGKKWHASPVRCVTAVDSRELCCLVTTGDDGRMCVLSWDGAHLGALSVAKGRIPAVAAAQTAPAGDEQPNESRTEGGEMRTAIAPPGVAAVARPPSTRAVQFADPEPPEPAPTSAPVVTTALLADGSSPASPFDGNDAWAIPVDQAARERFLTASACGILDEIHRARSRAAQVESALSSGGASKLDYDLVKEHERYMQRSCSMASTSYREEGDKQAEERAAVMETARRFSISGAETGLPLAPHPHPKPLADDGAADAPLDGRYRAIGQLLREKTYIETPTERALNEARRQAVEVMAATSPEHILARAASLAIRRRGSINRSTTVQSLPSSPAQAAAGGAGGDASGHARGRSGSGDVDPAMESLREMTDEDKAAWAQSADARRSSLMSLQSNAGFAAAGAFGGPGGSEGGAGSSSAGNAASAARHSVAAAFRGDANPADEDGNDGGSDDGDDSDDSDDDNYVAFAALAAPGPDRDRRQRELRLKSKETALDRGELPPMRLASGVAIDDPARIHRAEATVAWESAQYPSLVGERRRSVAETPASREAARVARLEAEAAAWGADMSEGLEAGGAARRPRHVDTLRALESADAAPRHRRFSAPNITSSITGVAGGSGRRPSLVSPRSSVAGGGATRSALVSPVTSPHSRPGATTTTARGFKTPGGAGASKAAQARAEAERLLASMAKVDASPEPVPAVSLASDVNLLLSPRRSQSESAVGFDAVSSPTGGATTTSTAPRGMAADLAHLSTKARVDAFAQLYRDEDSEDGALDGNGGGGGRMRGLLHSRNPQLVARLGAMHAGSSRPGGSTGGPGGTGKQPKTLRSLDVESLLRPKLSLYHQVVGGRGSGDDVRSVTKAATASALAAMTGGKTPAPERRFRYCPVADEEAEPEPPAPAHMVNAVAVAVAAVHWKHQTIAAKAETASCSGASVCPLPSSCDGSPPKSGAGAAGGSPPRPPSTRARRTRVAGAFFSTFSWERKLTRDEYLLLARRRRIGGEPKRDVLTFRDMLARIDRDGSGDISLEEFVAELDSNASGVRHMRRHLEDLFRVADTDGSGSLSLLEFARVMFPRATPTALNVICAFCTYDGPAPPDLLPQKKKELSAEALGQLRQLFDHFDEDGGGTIDREELRGGLSDIFKSLFPVEDKALSPTSVAREREKEDAFINEISAACAGVEELSFDDFSKLLGPYFLD